MAKLPSLDCERFALVCDFARDLVEVTVEDDEKNVEETEVKRVKRTRCIRSHASTSELMSASAERLLNYIQDISTRLGLTIDIIHAEAMGVRQPAYKPLMVLAEAGQLDVALCILEQLAERPELAAAALELVSGHTLYAVAKSLPKHATTSTSFYHLINR